MRVTAIYPLIVTPRLEETRRFYLALGFEVVFENDFYLHLRAKGPEEGPEIGFLLPDHPTQEPPFRTAYSGAGAAVTLVVQDAALALAEVQAAGLAPVLPLRDEPWGQRHFALLDPNGVGVDVVQPIEVADASYLEGYRRDEGSPPFTPR